ncbi:MAG: NUDIX hydrolase [Lentisphaeria bacterium]|jgi:8-oxo-dGTP pyrophosphatase MutT (NUDIX family)
MTHAPKRLARRDLALGNWLKLMEIEYQGHDGKVRTWEAAGRRHQQGAVMVIAQLQPSGRYVLVEQYRPPMDAMVVEFPAGLIDPGEEPLATAGRELREETGYVGSIRWHSRLCLSSPGMSGEAFYQVVMAVDEELPENRNPRPAWDESEHILTHLVAPAELGAFLREKEAAGAILDSKLVAFCLGAGQRW